jgi:glycosyltransferase involved in cell wall biosynthesis
MRVAIVHDWLVTWRGGEKVLEAIASIYPDAPIYTLFLDRKCLPPALAGREIIVHRGANFFRPIRKALLPLMPFWIESFSLEKYDLVISTSSCVAKGVMVGPSTKHLCYIHSPMRYVWDQRDEYLGKLRRIPVIGLLIEFASTTLRMWDTVTSSRVSQFVANSRFVKRRVERYYGKSSVVIHPPIDIERFRPKSKSVVKGDYFLAAGAFVGYKRFDLAIEACKQAGKKLVIAGSGPDLKKLQSLAGPNVEFEVSPSDDRWVELLQKAKALIFPGVEDFGMIAIESMAAGTPVIALKAGGALDFIVEETSGIYFDSLSADSLAKAFQRFDKIDWSSDALIRHSTSFSYQEFLTKMREQLEVLLSK